MIFCPVSRLMISSGDSLGIHTFCNPSLLIAHFRSAKQESFSVLKVFLMQLCERMASLAAITIDEKGLIVDLEEKKEILATLRNITKEFQTGDTTLKVLKGINLDIYKNEFIVVLGESGCGKSTMMNIVGGMDFLTTGELTIEGKDFSHKPLFTSHEFKT